MSTTTPATDRLVAAQRAVAKARAALTRALEDLQRTQDALTIARVECVGLQRAHDEEYARDPYSRARALALDALYWGGIEEEQRERNHRERLRARDERERDLQREIEEADRLLRDPMEAWRRSEEERHARSFPRRVRR